MRTRILVLVASLLITSLFLCGCAPKDNSVTNFDAPAFTLTSLDSLEISLEKLKGEVVVVHFGTSWCPFCRAEDPHLQALHELYQERGVTTLVVNVGENDEIATKWKKEAGFSFPMLMDRDGTVAARYAPIDAQPDLPRHEVMIASNLVIDRTGTVRFMSLLDTNNFDARLVALRATLDRILAES